MVLDEILTPSEYKLVMDDIQNLPDNLVENGAQLFNDQPEIGQPSQTYDSDHSDSKPKRKKPKRMCDSTYENPTYENVAVTNFEILPCLEPFAGQFDFHLQLPVDSSAHRWTFSKTLKKVFIDIDKVLALQFKWNFSELKADSEFYVRALPVYTSHDSLKLPVKRCPIHLLPNNALNIGFGYMEHVMRCEHRSTNYVEDPTTRRLSCITPLSRPQPGSDTTTLTYKFVCKTSCIGGMNRKPISVIFTLEDAAGNEYGRQLLAVKICSCPKRDKAKEEKNDQEKTQSCARLPNPLNSTPTVLCVRNTDVASHSQAEAFRDLKNVDYSELGSHSQTPNDTSKFKQYYKIIEKVRKEREDDIATTKDIAHRILDTVIRIEEHVNRLETTSQTSYGEFGRFVEAQLDEMHPELAFELQSEIIKTIMNKRIQVLRQSMPSYCPTPEPSVTSPCPIVEWRC